MEVLWHMMWCELRLNRWVSIFICELWLVLKVSEKLVLISKVCGHFIKWTLTGNKGKLKPYIIRTCKKERKIIKTLISKQNQNQKKYDLLNAVREQTLSEKKEEMDEFYLICLSDPNKNGQVNNKMRAKL